MSDYVVERAHNGFIVSKGIGCSTRAVYHTLDEVFDDMLAYFEGRASCFFGEKHGSVSIDRTPVPINAEELI